MVKKKAMPNVLWALLLLLGGCGEGTSVSDGNIQPASVVPRSTVSDAPNMRTFNASADLQTYAKTQLSNESERVFIEESIITADAQSDAAATTSVTNTYVAGIDELDSVKTQNGQAYWLRQGASGLGGYDRWFSLGHTATEAARLERIDLGVSGLAPAYQQGLTLDKTVNWRGLYTDTSGVTALGGSWAFESKVDNLGRLVREPTAASVHLQRFDHSLSALTTRTIEGSLIDSRRVGDQLILVLRHLFRPIANTATLPTTVSGGQEANLFSATDCLLSAKSQNQLESAHNGRLYSIVMLNAQTLAVQTSRCGIATAPRIHVTQNSLYLLDNIWDEGKNTAYVGKFALDFNTPNIGFRGWAQTPGRVQDGYGLSERGEHLLLFSTVGFGDALRHYLVTMSDTEQGFAQGNRYPNDDSQRIGKPGEVLYGIRFVGNRAYAVTFERTDPLYAFDVSTPLAPRELGALTLPGFSDLLHPVNDAYLLGIGSQVENGRVNGVQLSLFDVRQDTPRLVDQLSIPRAYQSLAWDHHRLTTLVVGDELRVALPVGGYLPTEGRWAQWSELFSVDTAGISLKSAGRIVTGDVRQYYQQPRALLTTSRVFDLRGTLNYAPWQTPANVTEIALP